MTDEISLLNNLSTREPYRDVEQYVSNEKMKKITKKVLVNILSCYTWVDVNTLLTNIKSVLNIKNIDDALAEVAILDDKTRQVRIKEEYFQDYDPYLFYGKKDLQKELEERFLEKMAQNGNVDFITGFYYTGLSEHLYEVQQNIYSGPLFDFLTKLFVEDSPESAALRPIALRLLLFGLNCTEYIISCNCDCNNLLKKINTDFQNNTMINTLSNLSEDLGFENCEIVVENIIESLERLKDFEPNMSSSVLKTSMLTPSEKVDKATDKVPKDIDLSLKESIKFYNKKKNISDHKGDDLGLEADIRITCSHCLQIH